MKKFCYLNGKIIETKKAVLPVNDLAVLRGYGVFDFLKTVNGKPFLWREHWSRFINSAKALQLKVPVAEKEAKEIVAALFKKNRLTDGSIRLVLTGGAAADGMTFSQPNFFILVEDLYIFPPAVFEKGAKVITHEYLRLVPGAKTINYITALRLQQEKKRAGAIEILYTDHGRVLECSTSNFFIVKKNKLITAKEDVLGGTTRNLVIKLARLNDIVVEERAVKVKELLAANETFLTATNKDITPVVSIDGRRVGDGKPGPITRQLMEALAGYMQNY